MNNAILNSWEKNAKEWNAAIERQNIPSRKYTNKAILEAIMSFGLQKVADLGCGEGWLCREMTKNRIEAIGFDATTALIEMAKGKGNEKYYPLQFEQIIKGQPLPHAPFDGAVFNFSLYQKDRLDLLFKELLNSIDSQGTVIVQTLHPFYLIGQGFGYRSQWLHDSWKGLPGNFEDGHSWYARTIEDWMALISKIPQTSFEIQEIINNEEKPISLLINIKKENG
ncbi:MAG: methyltransferase domain-containing protein [Bacteroidota bacterium]